MKELELKVEELEERIAPATLNVAPKGIFAIIFNPRVNEHACPGITTADNAGGAVSIDDCRGGPPVIGPPVVGGGHGDTGGGSGSDDNLQNYL